MVLKLNIIRFTEPVRSCLLVVYCCFLQQLTEALLSMEEDKAISLSKERASIEAIGQKEKLYTVEIASISEKLLEVIN